MRSRRRVLIGAAAVAVGGAIWSAFPIWAAVNGHSAAFWSQQSVSIQRLIGLLHTSGVTLPNGSPLTQFLRTFALYASGYASLLVGVLTLVTIAVRRGVLTRSPRVDGCGRPDPGLRADLVRVPGLFVRVRRRQPAIHDVFGARVRVAVHRALDLDRTGGLAGPPSG